MSEESWITKDGRKLKITDMTSEHLFNAAKLSVRYFGLAIREMQRRKLNTELMKLNLLIAEEKTKFEFTNNLDNAFQEQSVETKKENKSSTLMFPIDLD